MSVNGISSNRAVNAYVSTAAIDTKAAEETAETAAAPETADEAAVYASSSVNAGHALDADTIKAMKDELEQRTQNLVQQMLGKQLDTLTTADESFWEKFRTGEFTATPDQIARAQKDIADDGYWGVEQTSDRIVKYATALAGGDPDQLDTLIEAFEKGYKAAAKTWGGELPSLAQRTREAVLDKFDKLKEEYGASASAE